MSFTSLRFNYFRKCIHTAKNYHSGLINLYLNRPVHCLLGSGVFLENESHWGPSYGTSKHLRLWPWPDVRRLCLWP
jgi:hypothetical protein